MKGQNNKHTKSNEARLESIKHMHEHYNRSKQIIQASLKNVDVQKKHHIIFDDEENKDIIPNKIRKTAEKSDFHKSTNKNDVLNFENDFEEVTLNFPSTNKKTSEKLFSLQEHVGRNERFKIDERFADSDAMSIDSGVSAKSLEDTSNEVKSNLAVLHQVIGPPTIATAGKQSFHFSDPSTKRYDPSAELIVDDKGFEDESIAPVAEEKSNKKTKDKKPKVSKKQFYEVKSADLKQAFDKDNDGSSQLDNDSNYKPFSLLNMFGRDEEYACENANDVSNYKTENFQKLGHIISKMHDSKLLDYNSSSTDSSDDEDLDLENIKAKESEDRMDQDKPNRYFLFTKTDSPFTVAEKIFNRRTSVEDWDATRRQVIEQCNDWCKRATNRSKNKKQK